MVWILFPLSVVLGTTLGMAYKSGAQKISHPSEIPILIAIPSGILAVCFAAITCFTGFCLDTALLLPALLSGVSTFGAMYSLFRSMKDGYFALTIVFSGMSFCIPIFLSWLLIDEKVSPWQLSGIMLMLAAIIVVNFVGKKEDKTKETESAPPSKKWIVWTVGVCLFNGLANFGVKLQQHAMLGESLECFNFFNFLFCNVSALIFVMIYGCRKNNRVIYDFAEIKRIILPCLIIALCLGLNFYIQALLPQYVDASVQFTVCNGGSLVFGVLLGIFYYREPFDWRSVITLVCSSTAIVLQVI